MVWISISDHMPLPAFTKKVVVYDSEEGFQIANVCMRRLGNSWRTDVVAFKKDNGRYLNNVTHWMKLTKP